MSVLEVLSEMFGACGMQMMQEADCLKTVRYTCTVILHESLQFVYVLNVLLNSSMTHLIKM